MNWKEYIISDPDILIGKPTVKGTRLAVDFILGLLSDGWLEEEILKNYPALTKESLQAIFAFTRECMQTEAVFDIR
jgi:uncharacterized protein (DUF433 family)